MSRIRLLIVGLITAGAILPFAAAPADAHLLPCGPIMYKTTLIANVPCIESHP
jgi:hypothetical protein